MTGRYNILNAIIVITVLTSLFSTISHSGASASTSAFMGIFNRDTDMCLTADPSYKEANGSPVTQALCDYPLPLHQQWSVVDAGKYAQIRSDLNGKCLDVPLNKVHRNGAKLQLWDCYGTDQWNQLWSSDLMGHLDQAGVSGFWQVVNRHSGKCLDVPADIKWQSGVQLQQWDCYGRGQWNQHWGLLFW